MEKLNPQLNAVIHELFDRARAEAAGRDLPDGPFRGVPFLLKDLGAELAGTPFNEGLDFSGDYRSTRDPGADPALHRRRASSSVARRTRPSSGSCRRPSRGASGRRGTPGTRSTRPAGPRGARPRPWRRAWCPRRTPTTAGGRSGSRRRAAAWSGSSRPAGPQLAGAQLRRPDGRARRRARRDPLGARQRAPSSTPRPGRSRATRTGPRRCAGRSFAAAAATRTAPLRIAVMTDLADRQRRPPRLRGGGPGGGGAVRVARAPGGGGDARRRRRRLRGRLRQPVGRRQRLGHRATGRTGSAGPSTEAERRAAELGPH